MDVANRKFQGPDPVKLNRGIATAFWFLATVVVAGYVLKTGNRLYMAGFVALPFALMLMYRPDVAFVLAAILDGTGMKLSGISSVTLGVLAKLVIIGTFILAAVMLGKNYGRTKTMLDEKKPLICFSAIIVLLMAVRGAGIRALGSSTWGGMVYVSLFIGILFYLLANGLRINTRQIRWIIWGGVFAGMVGALLKIKGWSAAMEEGADTDVTRITWVLPIIQTTFPLVFALRGRNTFFSSLLFLACLGVGGLAGFRSFIVGLIAMAFGYGLFKTRDRVRYCFIAGIVAVIMWVGIIMISNHLPLGLQRTVSFIPGTQIDAAVAKNAEGSIEWRLDIWSYCLSQAKQYLLSGRGVAFDVAETVSELSISDIATYTPWLAFQTRSNHSGPLAILIDFGLPGFFVTLWLVIIIIKHFFRLARRVAGIETFEGRYALYLSVSIIWQWVAFYLVYGSSVAFSLNLMGTTTALIVVQSVLLQRNRSNGNENNESS